MFDRFQKLCYTPNLVKNFWLRLRHDFLPDINRNLNILAQTRLYTLAFDFWINAWWYKMANLIPPSIYPKIKCQNKGKFEAKCLNSCS
jgi:hypothetical protein